MNKVLHEVNSCLLEATHYSGFLHIIHFLVRFIALQSDMHFQGFFFFCHNVKFYAENPSAVCVCLCARRGKHTLFCCVVSVKRLFHGQVHSEWVNAG